MEEKESLSPDDRARHDARAGGMTNSIHTPWSTASTIDHRRHALGTVSMGPRECRAIGPFMLATGKNRPADEVEAAHADADAMLALFLSCPRSQWFAAAQAAMSVSDWGQAA